MIIIKYGSIDDVSSMMVDPATTTLEDIQGRYAEDIKMANGGIYPNGTPSYKTNKICISCNILEESYESLKNKTLNELGVIDGDDVTFSNKKGGNI